MKEITPDVETTEVRSSRPRYGMGPLWIFLIVIAFLFLVSWIFGFAFTPGSDRHFYENKIQDILKELALVQQENYDASYPNEYYSFEYLHDAGLMNRSYSLESTSEGYELTWDYYNRSWSTNHPGLTNIASFTIVAYPTIDEPRGLRTFGIGEDQVLRVYNPDNYTNSFKSREDPDVLTWDIVLNQ